MNFLKRAFWRIVRRKGQTLLMLGLFVIVCNLVLAGLSIQSATEQASDWARQKLGSEVTLEFNFDKLYSDGFAINQSDIKRVTTEMADKLAELDHVKAYNYLSVAFAVGDGVDHFSSDDGDKDDRAQGDSIQSLDGEEWVEPDFFVQGALHSEWLTDFSEGTHRLTTGRHLTEADAGKRVVMIEKRLAEQNNVHVGDEIKLSAMDSDESVSFEIVGIYETSKVPEASLPFDMPMMSPYNTMYIPYTETVQLNPAFEEIKEGELDQAVFYLDDPKHTEAFREQAHQSDIDFDVFRLDAKDGFYQQMVGPIENVAASSQFIVYLVSGAGAVILALLLILSIRGRRYEIGVVLSLGEKRLKVLGQLVAETLLILILAFGTSYVTGNLIAQTVGDNLLQREIAVSEGQGGANHGQIMQLEPGGTMSPGETERVEELSVKATFADWLQLTAIAVGIVLLAVAWPAISILRLHPKTILTHQE